MATITELKRGARGASVTKNDDSTKTPNEQIKDLAYEASQTIGDAIKHFEEQSGCRVFHLLVRENSIEIRYHTY